MMDNMLRTNLGMDQAALQNALISAISKQDIVKIKACITQGAKANIPNAMGSYPLNFAVEQSNPDIVRYLIQEGADVNKLDPLGKTNLHIATTRHNINYTILEFLLKHGMSIHSIDRHKNTGLHTAIYTLIHTLKYDLMHFLIYQGIPINRQNAGGDTVLHALARYSETENYIPFSQKAEYLDSIYYVLCQLVSHGADFDIKNHGNQTALDIVLLEYAKYQTPFHQNFLKIWLSCGAKVNVKAMLLNGQSQWLLKRLRPYFKFFNISNKKSADKAVSILRTLTLYHNQDTCINYQRIRRNLNKGQLIQVATLCINLGEEIVMQQLSTDIMQYLEQKISCETLEGAFDRFWKQRALPSKNHDTLPDNTFLQSISSKILNKLPVEIIELIISSSSWLHTSSRKVASSVSSPALTDINTRNAYRLKIRNQYIGETPVHYRPH